MADLGGAHPLPVVDDAIHDPAAADAAAEQGDPLAQRLLAETCDALAMSIGNAVNLYHPHRVVIGGGVSQMGHLFWDALREQTHRYVYEPFMDGGEIVPGALGERVVVIGAVLLAWQATADACE